MYSAIKIITIVILVTVSILYQQHLRPEPIADFIKDNNVIAPVIFILICAVRPVLFFLPSMGLTIVAGVLFGAVWGTVYVAIGGVASTVVGYCFARWLGRDAFKKIVQLNKHVMRLERWSMTHGKHAILSMRLFNLPWDIVSYWAGLTGVSFKEFYIASMIPLIPISFLYTYFGSKIFQPGSAGFIVSLLIMFLLGSVPFLMNRLKKRTYE